MLEWVIELARQLNLGLSDAGYYLRSDGSVIHEDSVGPIAVHRAPVSSLEDPRARREVRFWLKAHAAQARRMR